MELLIDIPVEQYEYIKKSDKNAFATVSSKECMLYAIKNGIPVSAGGALISREALKKAVTEATYNFEQIPIRVDEVMRIIDNASPVNIVNLEKQYFIKGFKDGCEHGKKCYERPRGEWIIDGHHIRCNRCNEYICNTDREGNKIPDSFCPNCGADMREVKKDE